MQIYTVENKLFSSIKWKQSWNSQKLIFVDIVCPSPSRPLPPYSPTNLWSKAACELCVRRDDSPRTKCSQTINTLIHGITAPSLTQIIIHLIYSCVLCCKSRKEVKKSFFHLVQTREHDEFKRYHINTPTHHYGTATIPNPHYKSDNKTQTISPIIIRHICTHTLYERSVWRRYLVLLFSTRHLLIFLLFEMFSFHVAEEQTENGKKSFFFFHSLLIYSDTQLFFCHSLRALFLTSLLSFSFQNIL